MEVTRMIRRLLPLPSLFLSACVATAQPPVAQPVQSFPELRQHVAPGETIYVVDAVGEEVKGRLLNIRDTGITVGVDGMRKEFSLDNVAVINRVRRDPVKNGVLTGLASGALIGLAVGWRADSPTCSRDRGIECRQGAIIGAYGGAFWGSIFGWIVDAAHRTRETIFTR